MIERRNILDLIGRSQGKYHSCVLTCYSLDFTFFEERVLPTLRSANIKNVNVIADGKYLERIQEITTGNEFKNTKTYNFQPIYVHGVFHPKILLLTGKEHGLLIIGSGNITSSGLSTNDEIWAAFHLNTLENDNAPLFGAVWNYLQPYLNESMGFVKQKLRWMKEYSPWLSGLPEQANWVKIKDPGMDVHFIGNTNEHSIFQQLDHLIPWSGCAEITVISPYYDRNGDFLMQLKEHYKPIIMRCIMDPHSDLLPIDLPQNTANSIEFFYWADCKKDFEDQFHRLHAKLIHWTCDNSEYLLLGSANSTSAAMGQVDALAINSEAGVLLRRQLQKESWLIELGITIPAKGAKLPELKTNKSIEVKENEPKTVPEFRVLYAELKESEVNIFTNKALPNDGSLSLKVVDRNDVLINSNAVRIEEMSLKGEIHQPENAFKLILLKNGVPASNHCLIHRLDALLRCNPDSTQEKLDLILGNEFFGGDGISDLLQFTEMSWADEGSESQKQNNRIVNSANHRKETQIPTEFETLSEEEFNMSSSLPSLMEMPLYTDPNVKINDALNAISSRFNLHDSDYRESEEQRLFEEDQVEGDGQSVEYHRRRAVDGEKEKQAIHKYLKRLETAHSKVHKRFFSSCAISEFSSSPITIRSISSILIGVHIVQIKYGRKFAVALHLYDTSNQEQLKDETYISVGSKGDPGNTLKGFLLNILGGYFLALNAGIRNYDFDLINQKMTNYLTTLLTKSLFLILNTPWKESEETDKKLLVLNTLYSSKGELLIESKAQNDLISGIEGMVEQAHHLIPDFNHELNLFRQVILPRYVSWANKFYDIGLRQKLIQETTALKPGDIIFNNKLGFSMVQRIHVKDGQIRLDLSRPGFPYVDNEFELKHFQFGRLCVRFFE